MLWRTSPFKGGTMLATACLARDAVSRSHKVMFRFPQNNKQNKYQVFRKSSCNSSRTKREGVSPTNVGRWEEVRKNGFERDPYTFKMTRFSTPPQRCIWKWISIIRDASNICTQSYPFSWIWFSKFVNIFRQPVNQ